MKSCKGHTPVLSQEVLAWLQPVPSGTYVDCTLGPGGLAKDILEKIEPSGCLIGIDQDINAITLAKQHLLNYRDCIELVCGNFKDVKKIVGRYGKKSVDGIVFDLGISSIQLDDPERGFTFLEDGPLDMRMDQTRGPTAAELLNSLSEADLRSIIFQFGEERYARRIASSLIRTRELQPIQTTYELASLIRKAVPPPYRHGRLHCATRTFMALRLAVNRELEGLDMALKDAVDLLAPGGRICVISFHSGEDRIVKQVFRSLSQGDSPLSTVLTKKPVTASSEEQQINPRARSAKLRVAERRNMV